MWHVFLRAIYSQNNDDQYNLSIDKLLDAPLSKKLFGLEPHGEWRKKVIDCMRIPQLLRWYFDQHISYQKFLINEDGIGDLKVGHGIRFARIHSIYQKIIGDLTNIKNQEHIDEFLAMQDDAKFNLVHTSDEVINAIKNTHFNYGAEDDEETDINEYLKEDKVINLFIKDDNAEYSCEVKKNDEFIQSLLKEHKKFIKRFQKEKGYAPEPIGLDGESLTDQELANLIKIERQNNGLLHQFKDIPFDIIQDDRELEGDNGLIVRINKGLKNENYCHVVYLHGDAHWLALVISKVGGTVDCVIADSLNKPRFPVDYLNIDNDVYNDQLKNSELTQHIWSIVKKLDCNHVIISGDDLD